ncbi:MAG: hypothetical protein FJZ58_04000 [Chlamydiae bacterium]|nr:hypothetical protein [Chlamydiota bacterium]
MKYDEYGCPTIDVDIDGHPYSLPLAIGSRFPLLIHKELLDHLNTVFVKMKALETSEGYIYEMPSYKVPNIRIGPLVLPSVIAMEVPRKKDEALGRGLGGNFNLLIDLAQNQLVVCDRFSKLQKKGYATENWVQIPFTSHRFGLSLQILTTLGSKNLILDTTLTTTSFCSSAKEQEPILSQFHIEGQELGKISCTLTAGPSDVDGFLGLDFIRQHSLYIDFTHQCIYINPSTTVLP